MDVVQRPAPPDARPADRTTCGARALCAWCGAVGVPIPVHGHLQCPRCGTNVDPCCGGETATPDDGAESAP